MISSVYHKALLLLTLLLPGISVDAHVAVSSSKETVGESVRADEITIFAVSSDGNRSPAALNVITASGEPIVAKPNGKTHKKPYDLGDDLQCTVSNGKVTCLLPRTHWYDGSTIYEVEFLQSGKQKNARAAVLKCGESTLAIIETPNDNTHIEVSHGTRTLPDSVFAPQNRATLCRIRHRLANALQLIAEKGRIAQRMLHQK